VKGGASAERAGIHAGKLAGEAAKIAGGRGGGRADFGRGSVKDLSRREDALAMIRDAVDSRTAGAGA
jgi:alanyl-tRNA synthetase